MDFRLLMLSAMYENGGNTVHRFLDGHPEMFVYPFESQLGTALVHDHLTSMFPVKYRWPTFALDATPFQDYKSIIDEECKVRARTPKVSKFRDMPFALDDDERCAIYVKIVSKTGRSRPGNVGAFLESTLEAWKDYARTGEEKVYVGYSPIIAVDADKIVEDFPAGHVLHVVRNPWSAYADTKKRPVPLSLERYLTAWCISQYHALTFRKIYPERIHIVRLEDVLADPGGALGEVCKKVGIHTAETLTVPTWNGNVLEEVYPWGTIRRASSEANRATAEELSLEEKERVGMWTEQYLDVFGYKDFLR